MGVTLRPSPALAGVDAARAAAFELAPDPAFILSPEGRLDFVLPNEAPAIGLDIGAGIVTAEVVLHTVQIRMEDRELDLVWRAAVPYPGREWLPQMRRMDLVIGSSQ